MKNFRVVLGLCFVCVVAVCSCLVGTNKTTVTQKKYSIDDMSLDEKIGQMLFVEYRSGIYTSDLYDAIYKYKPGGFILYSENLWNKNDYFELIRKLNKSSDIPIFIGIDQEGGYMQRLKSLGDVRLTKLKSLEDLGNDDLLYTYLSGKVNGEELATFGINVNFSPVLDISTTSDNEFDFSRSFSISEDEVAEYGKNYILGLNNHSVVSCAKHLPGIGDGTENTHYGSSYISHDIIPNITGNVPLTLSKDGIDYLKDYLDYDGLIVSDGLRMKALTNYYSTEELLVGAINAGVDVLLASEKMSITVGIIKRAVIDGKINEERINESVKKILRVKEKLNKREYIMSDFLLTYHKLLLRRSFGDDNDLVDNYIFNLDD